MDSMIKNDLRPDCGGKKKFKSKTVSLNTDEFLGTADVENVKGIDAVDNNNDDNKGSAQDETRPPDAKRKLLIFLDKYSFPLLTLIVIALAKAYPPLGAVYLAPQVTATWIAVMIMFLYSGLGLKTNEFVSSLKQMHFNAYVQIFNFMICSSVVFGFTRILVRTNALDLPLIEGMIVCSCLPIALNTVEVLTVAAGGEEAVAIFNTMFGNLIGIFLSPVLIVMYIGRAGSMPLSHVVMSLAIRVIVPVVLGQLLQHFVSPVYNYFVEHKWYFAKFNQYLLVYIVYTVFCKTFMSTSGSEVGNILLMLLFQFILMSILLVLSWFSSRILFRNKPKLRIMGLFGCTHKTIAFGIPLITTLYQGNPDIGLFSLPVLIWHPLSVVLGSLLVPSLKRFLEVEEERLNLKGVDSTVSDTESVGAEEDVTNGEDGEGNAIFEIKRNVDVESSVDDFSHNGSTDHDGKESQ